MICAASRKADNGGGEGYDLQYWVGAKFAAQMFAQTSHEFLGCISSVSFEKGGLDCEVDDVVVQGRANATLYVQSKGEVTVPTAQKAASSCPFTAALAQFVRAVCPARRTFDCFNESSLFIATSFKPASTIDPLKSASKKFKENGRIVDALLSAAGQTQPLGLDGLKMCKSVPIDLIRTNRAVLTESKALTIEEFDAFERFLSVADSVWRSERKFASVSLSWRIVVDLVVCLRFKVSSIDDEKEAVFTHLSSCVSPLKTDQDAALLHAARDKLQRHSRRGRLEFEGRMNYAWVFESKSQSLPWFSAIRSQLELKSAAPVSVPSESKRSAVPVPDVQLDEVKPVLEDCLWLPAHAFDRVQVASDAKTENPKYFLKLVSPASIATSGSIWAAAMTHSNLLKFHGKDVWPLPSKTFSCLTMLNSCWRIRSVLFGRRFRMACSTCLRRMCWRVLSICSPAASSTLDCPLRILCWIDQPSFCFRTSVLLPFLQL
jgi:hypothetical protein